MAIRINGTTGIDMGNTPVSNVDVGVLDYNAVNKEYADTKQSKSELAYNVNTSSYIPNTLESGAIIEIGSNANGEYIKFADGTLILNIGISKEHNSLSFTFNVTTPHSFLGLLNVSVQGSLIGSSIGKVASLRVGGTGTTHYTPQSIIGIAGTFDVQVTTFTWGIAAIARWK